MLFPIIHCNLSPITYGLKLVKLMLWSMEKGVFLDFLSNLFALILTYIFHVKVAVEH